ncbi:MAG: DNA-directed RNA polymerase subunit omega [candidate division Zixibacteria bacterium RBG_16_53_22]|nr:MAG: DNA-directed RNA polymerase subunit omega [candidate division Zixibacteria bacterium RBG_16_53_22]
MENSQKPLEEVVPNEYEAVLVAARLARKINAERQAVKEQTAPEEFNKMEQRKVTSVALDQLKSGKVKFDRRKTEEEVETFDLT